MKYLIKLITLFSLFGLAGIAHATVGSLIPSQISCTAPCPVQFDMISTTDPTVPNPFGNLRYDIDFDDTGSGNWSTSGKPKGSEAGGPLAAHIYDTPGTYTPNLNVGDDSVTNATITVANPDDTWAGTDTICLTTGSDFTGCPAGATQSGSLGSWPAWASGKRYMLREGDNFMGLGVISFRNLNTMRVTSYGSGAKPIVHSVTAQYVTKTYPTTGDSWLKNVDIIGLNTGSVRNYITSRHLLVYQNTVTGVLGVNSGIQVGLDIPYQVYNNYDNVYIPRFLFIVDNYMVNPGSSAKATGDGQMTWMGNTIQGTYETNVRLFAWYKTLFAHNRLLGGVTRPFKANIKMHARGSIAIPAFTTMTNPEVFLTPSINYASNYGVVASNYFYANDGIWVTTSIKPQDRDNFEGIENVIVEFNTHEKGNHPNPIAGAFLGRNMFRRNETHAGGISCPALNYAATIDGNPAARADIPIEWQGPYYMGTSGGCYLDGSLPIPPGDIVPTPNIEVSKAFVSHNPDTTTNDGRVQTVVYRVTAINTGTLFGTYDITENMYPGTGITVSTATPPTIEFDGLPADTDGSVLSPFTGAGGLVVDDETIQVGETETWTVTITFDVDQEGTLTDTVGSAQCDTGRTDIGGLANVVSTDYAGDSLTNDRVCVDAFFFDPPPPTGGIEVSQSVNAGQPTGTDDIQTVVTTITVVNSSTGSGTYNLYQTVKPGTGITVSTVTVPTIVHGGEPDGSGGGEQTPLDLTTGTEELVLLNEPIAALTTETWTITVTYDVDQVVLTPTEGSAICVPPTVGNFNANGGLNNRVTTDAIGDNYINDIACVNATVADIPVTDDDLTQCWDLEVPTYKHNHIPNTGELAAQTSAYWAGNTTGVTYPIQEKCIKTYQ